MKSLQNNVTCVCIDKQFELTDDYIIRLHQMMVGGIVQLYKLLSLAIASWYMYMYMYISIIPHNLTATNGVSGYSLC